MLNKMTLSYRGLQGRALWRIIILIIFSLLAVSGMLLSLTKGALDISV